MLANHERADGYVPFGGTRDMEEAVMFSAERGTTFILAAWNLASFRDYRSRTNKI